MVASLETNIVEHLPAEPVADRLIDLEQRLGRGMEIIDERIIDGLPVDRYEEHWFSLLAEYERLYDMLHPAH